MLLYCYVANAMCYVANNANIMLTSTIVEEPAKMPVLLAMLAIMLTSTTDLTLAEEPANVPLKSC